MRGLLPIRTAVLALIPAVIFAAAARAQTVDPEEYASRSITRVAILDLRARPMPGPDDYLVAERLLQSASFFQPDDAELLRMRIRAAWAAADSDQVDRLTRALVRVDPADTVAQLRLASSRMSAIQTVEQRLAAYDRLLGPAGAPIDPAVRSRLALDAALLCRERNDFAGFTERLTLAAQLDSTNKDAAALAWSYYGPHLTSPAERLELLLNLLMADPTDPNVHRQVATELAMTGAFEQAQRFHRLAVELYTALQPALDDRIAVEAAVIRWQVEGPEAVVESLNRELGLRRQDAANRIALWEQQRMPTDSLPKPDAIMLAPIYNQMRLVAAIMAEDPDTIAATLSDITAVFGETISRSAQALQLAPEEERPQRITEFWAAISQQLIAVAWADATTDALREWAERATTTFGEDAPTAKMLNAWKELRLGDPAAAVEAFAALPKDLAINRVGLAIALEKVGRSDEANEELRTLALESPLSLPGVWARDRARRATGVDPMATADRAAVTAIARGVPAWVDRMATNPRGFMAMSAEAVDPSLLPTGRAALRIRLTNLSAIPLGVGGDRTLNSRFLLSPRLETGTGRPIAGTLPEVHELDRRLRLMPGETLDAVLWPDPGLVGWLSEVGALETVRQRWRVIQGYALSDVGVPIPGALCLETETRGLVRFPLPLGGASATDLADALDAAAPADLPEVLATIRARSLLAADARLALTPDDLNRIASIAADRYPSLNKTARATMLAVLLPASITPGMEPFDTVALAEEDPDLAVIAMATRISDPDHPVLIARLRSESDGLGSFTRALRERLHSGLPTFARFDAAMLRVNSDTGATR